MDKHLAGIMDQALELPQEMRVILVRRLWNSLDQDHRLPPDEISTVITAYQRDLEMEDGSARVFTLEEALLELDGVLDESDFSPGSPD